MTTSESFGEKTVSSVVRGESNIPSKVAFKGLFISIVVFLICWALLLSLGMRWGYSRAQGNYFRTPRSIKNMCYPLWLLQQSRAVRPDNEKLIFLGDSTVFGSSCSDVSMILPVQMKRYLESPEIQWFAFSTLNLNAKDYRKLLDKNVRESDYVIFELIPSLGSQKAGRQLTLGESQIPPPWLVPFQVIKSEVSTRLGFAPSLIPFECVDYLKRSIHQRTFSPRVNQDELVPFPDSHHATDPHFISKFVDLLNQPFDEASLEALRALTEIPNLDLRRLIVYFIPLNPVVTDNPELGLGSVFEMNRSRVREIFEKKGVVFVDYSAARGSLELNDFHDAYHLTDSGCAKFGEMLADQWLKRIRGHR
jgi:hypothetical protein